MTVNRKSRAWRRAHPYRAMLKEQSCVVCGGAYIDRPSRRCHCDRCLMAFYQSGDRAMAAVAKAIATGALMRPATYKCVDCDKQAQQYDHRDYRKPLDVDPVCRSCNQRRGRALFDHLAIPTSPRLLARWMRATGADAKSVAARIEYPASMNPKTFDRQMRSALGDAWIARAA